MGFGESELAKEVEQFFDKNVNYEIVTFLFNLKLVIDSVYNI
jgi:hypothetical protein